MRYNMRKSEVVLVLKLLKICLVFLLAVLLLWGILAFFLPNKDDEIFRVVIDPGHGGKDPGAVAGDIYEKDINLAISLLVCDNLSGLENLSVSITRDDDSYLSLNERAEFANKRNADLYISIHANALEDTNYSGLFTFYHSNKPLSKEAAEAIQCAAVSSSGALDRGIRAGNYTVLRLTNMPAVLVETGFMTCPEELAKLINREYQMKIAEGISNGILAFIADI